MGRLPHHDERPYDCAGQAARGQTGRGQGNLAAVIGKVIALGEGAGGQGRLTDRTADQLHGCRDRGKDTRHETPVETAFTGI